MSEKAEQLLAQVEQNHDWDQGQCWGGGGTQLSSTDTCRICGLERKWFSDTQNGVEDRYTFISAGETLPLRDAAEFTC